jgi:xanthine dehydrogenase accessory factor
LKELLEIVHAWESAPEGAQAVLITVVDIKGSAYRRPGARLLIVDGQAYGSISGGCLESDLILSAWDRTEDGPEVAVFDTTTEEAWGYGLGCRGIISVLIRRISAEDEELVWLRAHLHGRQASDRVVRLDERQIAKPVREQDLVELLKGLLPAHAVCGRVEVDGSSYFVETMLPRLALSIFGAGFDAAPISRMASDLGWECTVYDYRSALLTRERFPAVTRLEWARFDEMSVPSDRFGAAIVMTHNFEQDRAALSQLLHRDLLYIGLLGPRNRTERILREVGDEVFHENLYSPIGLDIGAESPNEIALAICAEIQAVSKRREAGFLRDRSIPIHATFPVF